MEPMNCHEFANRPWLNVGADICYLDNRILLVLVDYYSNYIEVCRLQSQISTSIIKEIQAVFARFGVPDQLMTDNGPQLTRKYYTLYVPRRQSLLRG